MMFWISDLALGSSTIDPDRTTPPPRSKRRTLTRRLVKLLSAAEAWTLEWYRSKQRVLELERLSDHLLADAGLTRQDVEDMRSGIYRPRPRDPEVPPRVRRPEPPPEPRQERAPEVCWREAA